MTPKVCILTETYYPVIGGGETQARSLARGLQAYDHPICLVTRRSQAEFSSVDKIDGIKVYRVQPSGSGQMKKWSIMFTVLPMLFNLRHHFDLILVSGFRILGIPALIFGFFFGKICVLKADSQGELSGEYFRDGLVKLNLTPGSPPFRMFISLRNRLFKRADAFVAISSQIQAELESGGIDKECINKIPNSVDIQRFRPVNQDGKDFLRKKHKLPSDKKIVVYTGRLVTYKGLPNLIRVWDQLCQTRSDLLLLLVGSGGMDIHNCEADLKTYVNENDIEDMVHFAGSVNNVQEYLQAADIFVFPTENEAFGISLIEAMACGLPAVSTQIGGVRDILMENQTALTIEPGQKTQLFKNLESLLDDDSLRQKMGRAARKITVHAFSDDTVTRTYIKLFKALTTEDDIIN